MPRKKMTKRKIQASTKRSKPKQTNSFSATALTKVEKEFFVIPTNLVKNATKQLTVLQKKNSKLAKAVAKFAGQAEKLEKKLLAIKESKKVVKRAVASALKKQHQAALKQHTTLAKEQKLLLASLTPLEIFHAKFNFLSKQLPQLDKEWIALQKAQAIANQSNGLKSKTTTKKKKSTPAAGTVVHEGTTYASTINNEEAEEFAQSEEVNA